MSMIIYDYQSSQLKWHQTIEIPILQKIIDMHPGLEKTAFEIGCGNGSTADILQKQGFHVTGIDPSPSGIDVAKQSYPQLLFHIGSSDDDLAGSFGTYPFVYSLETIAHVVNSQLFAKRVYELLQPGGVAIISAPFHGYWKNLALSLFNKWDVHANPLWDGRYLSIFSEKTFRQLWSDAGFQNVKIVRAGRFQFLANSMIAVLQKD